MANLLAPSRRASPLTHRDLVEQAAAVTGGGRSVSHPEPLGLHVSQPGFEPGLVTPSVPLFCAAASFSAAGSVQMTATFKSVKYALG